MYDHDDRTAACVPGHGYSTGWRERPETTPRARTSRTDHRIDEGAHTHNAAGPSSRKEGGADGDNKWRQRHLQHYLVCHNSRAIRARSNVYTRRVRAKRTNNGKRSRGPSDRRHALVAFFSPGLFAPTTFDARRHGGSRAQKSLSENADRERVCVVYHRRRRGVLPCLPLGTVNYYYYYYYGLRPPRLLLLSFSGGGEVELGGEREWASRGAGHTDRIDTHAHTGAREPGSSSSSMPPHWPPQLLLPPSPMTTAAGIAAGLPATGYHGTPVERAHRIRVARLHNRTPSFTYSTRRLLLAARHLPPSPPSGTRRRCWSRA